MKWIVITLPDFIENESTYINQLFKAGINQNQILRIASSCYKKSTRNGIKRS